MTKPENSLSEVFTENCAWQSNVPESAVNHANMQIPLNGSAEKENCAFLKSNCWHEMQTDTNCSQRQTKSRCFFLLINPTKCNSTTIESGKLIWVSFRHRIVDLIQWSVVLITFTLKSLSKPMAHAAQSANFCMSWSVRNFFNLSSDQKRFDFGSSRVTALHTLLMPLIYETYLLQWSRSLKYASWAGFLSFLDKSNKGLPPVQGREMCTWISFCESALPEDPSAKLFKNL